MKLSPRNLEFGDLNLVARIPVQVILLSPLKGELFFVLVSGMNERWPSEEKVLEASQGAPQLEKT